MLAVAGPCDSISDMLRLTAPVSTTQSMHFFKRENAAIECVLWSRYMCLEEANGIRVSQTPGEDPKLPFFWLSVPGCSPTVTQWQAQLGNYTVSGKGRASVPVSQDTLCKVPGTPSPGATPVFVHVGCGRSRCQALDTASPLPRALQQTCLDYSTKSCVYSCIAEC